MVENRTHSFVSDGTFETAVKRRVSVVAGPIFEGAIPQETKIDSMAIKNRDVKLYRPNNLRRQVVVDSGDLATIGEARGKCRYLFFPRVTVQIGKRVLTAVWQQRKDGKKEVFRFEGSKKEVIVAIEDKRAEICSLLDGTLQKVGVDYGLEIGEPIWERKEESIKGDFGLDGLPRDMVLHDTVFKKVYDDDLEFIEGKGVSAGYVKNYLNNRALEDFAPEIVAALDGLHSEISGLNRLERVMERVVVFPEDLLRPDVQVLVAGLNGFERAFFSDWLFERFGHA